MGLFDPIWQSLSGVNPNTNYLTQKAISAQTPFERQVRQTSQQIVQKYPNAFAPRTSGIVDPMGIDQTTSGGGGGGSGRAPSPQPSQPSGPSPEELARQTYMNQLNDMYNSMEAGLMPQRTAQEDIVNTNYNQGLSDLQAQATQGKADLATTERKTMENQNKTLKDLADNIRNQYQAGNVYLGSRGAGDSSAANMYGYAINQLGSKQRGDIMSQTASIVNDIRDRESRLNNTVIQETRRLASERNNQLSQIAQWFSEAQNQIRGMKGQDLSAMSQMLLQDAINKANMIDQDYRNKATALQQWALNNSNSITQLKSNLQQVSSMQPSMPSYSPILGTPSIDNSGNYTAPVGFGYSDEERKRLQGY